jgi:peptidoglycan/LPS O-acetylase OafA/YrhL
MSSVLRPAAGDDLKLSRAIDFTRAIAILLVLTTHTGQQFRSGDAWVPSSFATSLTDFLNLGASGVGMFFVLSGFLMEYLYGGRTMSQKRFWARRLGRIYPLWLLWTLIAIVAAYIPIALDPANPTILYGHALRFDSLGNVGLTLLHLAFLGFLVPTIWNSFILGGWSIQAEMIHYALFVRIQRAKLEIVLAIYLVIEIAYAYARPALDSALPDYELIFDALVTSPIWFILGIYLARFRRSTREKPTVNRATHILLGASLAVTVFLPGPFVPQWVTLIVVVVSILLAITLAARINGRPLIAIGKVSYGMYFAHFVILLPITRLVQFGFAGRSESASNLLVVPTFLLAYAFVLAGSYAVASLTFRFLEKPVLDWARRRF